MKHMLTYESFINEGNAARWSKSQLDKEIRELAAGTREAGDIDSSMVFDIADSWLGANPGADTAIKKHYRVKDVMAFVADRIV